MFDEMKNFKRSKGAVCEREACYDSTYFFYLRAVCLYAFLGY